MKAKKISLFILLLLFSITSIAAENFRLRINTNTLNTLTEEDIRAEIEFGKTVGARILGQYQVHSNKSLIRYVNLVGQVLVFNSPRQDIEFHFSIIESSTINAYSTPGGYVFITTGAINIMRDESELAAVLAHEIAHVTKKHIVNELKIRGKDNSTVSGVTRLVRGSKDSAAVAFQQTVDKAINLLLERGFKHEDELEADQVAITLLAQAGYDPESLGRYLKRLIKSAENNTNSKTNTHPATHKRLNILQKYSEKEGLLNLNFSNGEKRFRIFVAEKR